jgi:hypothetical protein
VNNADYLLIRSVAVLRDEEDLIKHAMLVYSEYKKYDNKKVVLDGLATGFPSDLFSLLRLSAVLYRKISSGGQRDKIGLYHFSRIYQDRKILGNSFQQQGI